MRATILLVGVVALLALLSPTQLAADLTVSFDNDHSTLKVVLPPALKTFAGLEGLRHSQALFGTPSYGGDKEITGELFYVTPGDKTGCDEFSDEVPKNVPKGTNKIFLVDRGACDFVQKMRTAQKLGAVAVIIADNVCQCTDYLNDGLWVENSDSGRTPQQKQKCTELGAKARAEQRIIGTDSCERGLPFMADDGTGSDVVIPSFLIDYLDAQPLKDCLISAADKNVKPGDLLSGQRFSCPLGTKVVVSLGWDIPRKDGRVDWELWSSSDSEGVFKKGFAAIAKKIQYQALFRPRYFVWDGEKWGCTIGDICSTQCTNGGYYCNPDPDHNLFDGVSGRDVVEENLRELCVWDQASSRNVTGLWWDYVTSFATRCHPKATPTSDKFNLQCSEAVQREVGIDPAQTAECVRKSWTSPKYNELLHNEIVARGDLKILTLPTALVRSVPIRGGVTPQNVLTAICGGYAPGKIPQLCSCVDRSNYINLLECINSDCPTGLKLCPRNNKCYSQSDYTAYCSDLCPKDTDTFCPTLSACLPSSEQCPPCPDPQKPTYCTVLGKCVESLLTCTPPPTPGGQDKGTSAMGVFAITLVVVSFAGCGAYMFWRRQRARLHDDVKAILSSYMALEETDDAGDRVSRQSRRTEPAIQPSSQFGASSSSSQQGGGVGGQDAAQFI